MKTSEPFPHGSDISETRYGDSFEAPSMTTEQLQPQAYGFDTIVEEEPIQTPGRIQPYGLLFVLSTETLTVLQVSENVREQLGIEAAEILGTSIVDRLGQDSAVALQQQLEATSKSTNPLEIQLQDANGATQKWSGLPHYASSGEIILELEPWDATAEQNVAAFLQQFQHILKQIQQLKGIRPLADLIVQEVQQITGFDRVMVYRFNDRGDGTVIAEAKQEKMTSLLGLNYPYTDIPAQARVLYQQQWLRLLHDAQATPAKLIDMVSDADEAREPLDMGQCVLRSSSRCHGAYLQNMDITASMGISLMHQQNLWGLIICHHKTPKIVPYAIRSICEFLGHLMSTELTQQEANENLEYKLQIQTLQSRLVDGLAGSDEFVPTLATMATDLCQLAGATGAAIVDDEAMTLLGETPEPQAVTDLLTWLTEDKVVQSQLVETGYFATDALAQQYAAASEYKDLASGLLMICMSQFPARYLVWFRPELLQTVNWGRDFANAEIVEIDGAATLTPDQSFVAWKETVEQQSHPWLDCEVKAALVLKDAIVEIVLRQAKALAMLNLELERSNSELSAFAYVSSHDLQEPLRKIRAFGDRLKQRAGDGLDEKSQDYLRRMLDASARAQDLIDDLLTFSRVTSKAKPFTTVGLQQIVRNVLDDLEVSIEQAGGQVDVGDLPAIEADALQMRQLFQNLLTNALKFNRKGIAPVVTITAAQIDRQNIRIAVADNGIGIDEKYRERIFQVFQRLHDRSQYKGTGIGLAICRKIVERHQGSLTVESQLGAGSTFIITLPRHHREESSYV